MPTNGPFPPKGALPGATADHCPSAGQAVPGAAGSEPEAERRSCAGPVPERVDGVQLFGASGALRVDDRAVDALDRWLSNDAVQPKHVGEWEEATRWIRRHPRVSGLAIATMASSIIMAIGALVAYLHTADTLRQVTLEHNTIERDRAQLSEAVSRKVAEIEIQEDRCRSQQKELQQLASRLQALKVDHEQCQQQCQAADQRLTAALRDQRLELAEQLTRQASELHVSLPDTSLLLASKSLTITQEEQVPPIPSALQQVRDLLAPDDERTLSGHEGPVAQLASSRDGKWLASGDYHGTVRLWATSPTSAVNAPKLLHGHWGRITHLMFTADSRWLLSSSSDSTMYLWDLEATDPAAEPVFLQGKSGRIVAVVASGDGRWLAAASVGSISKENSVRLWDLHASDIVTKPVDLPAYRGRVRTLAVSPDGQWVASGDDDGIVRLWRFGGASHAVASTTLRVHDAPVRIVKFSPDGNWLIAAACGGDKDNTIHAWNLADAETAPDVVLANDSHKVKLLDFTADGRWLVAAGEQPALRVWDLAALDTRPSATVLQQQLSPVQSIALSTTGRWLATAGTDNTVRVWHVGPTGPAEQPVTVQDGRGQITSMAFTEGGDWLTTGNDQGNIRQWNLDVDELIRMANSKLLP